MTRKWAESFEIRIAAAIAAAVLIVIVIGFIAYSSLTRIVSGVAETTHQDGKLLLLKEVLADVTDAESHVKSFTFTNDPKYLQPYTQIVTNIDKKLIELKRISEKDTLGAVVDTLTLLVHRKFIVLNDFIALRDTGRLGVILNNLSDKISPGMTPAESPKTTSGKQALLNRIWGRTKKKSKSENTYSGPVASVKDVQQEIERLRYLEEENAEYIARSQMELTEQDKAIMENIRAIFQKLEKAEREKIAAKTTEAESLAINTNKYITAFSIALALMLFALGFFIVNNIKKSRAYSLQLELAKTETEQLADAKELFLANMSHEIRTPLHAITGFSEQLINTRLDATQMEHMEIIKRSGDHLLKLVNNVLDLTKIHAGKLIANNESFLTEDLILDAINVVKPLAAEKKIALSSSMDDNLPEMLWGDPVKFKQVLINILSNAVKFTEVGQVQLIVHVKNLGDDEVVLDIEIRDTGIGIASDQIATIFDEFVQVSNRESMKFGGTGLGLTISKKLCEFLGGSLVLTSEKGKGTSVLISLPFKVRVNARTAEKKPTALSVPDFHNKKILIADDELYNLKLLGILLDKWNASYISASNGKEVLEKLANTRFDIILLDLSMPEMNGLDTARAIRANKTKSKANIPLIALTASAEPETVAECLKAGIDQVLIKPFLEEELVNVLNSVFYPDRENLPFRKPAPKVEVPEGANGFPSYNLEELKRMSPDDPAFARDMLQTFIESTTRNLDALADAVARENVLQLGELAHTMAAPCRHLGMKEVVDMLKRIEIISNQKKLTDELVELVDAVQTRLKKILEELEVELKVF